MKYDVSELIHQCIHCIVRESGSKIPRKMSMTVHGSRSNDVIHSDYLFMSIDAGDMKYVLIIKDDV